MNVDDIEVDGEQMPCPNCGRPLNIDLVPTHNNNLKPDRLRVMTLCCDTELECDAETFIDLLPEVKAR